MAFENGIRQTLREWAPLTELFSKLPAKHQNGLFHLEVKITCIDVLPEFIALGTNVGIVYLFDRNKKDMQRLRCENNIPITVLKIISSVDYMVASGNATGNISIFQIPKSHPDNLPESLRPKNKQLERYTVSALHKAAISAIDWAKNGMKLFSGDKSGCVVLTEIDFYMHICKSVEILNEAYEVIQLSYNQQHLLVSTLYRSIICKKMEKWQVTQVGTKDRKLLGSFGGIIYQHSEKPSDTCLYCTRPGLRMWISDIQGNVQKTLLFKELLTKECPEVPLINPISTNIKKLKPQREAAFGILLPFNKKLLVTYNNDVVYILDPKEMIILSTVSQLRGVLDVATSKDEIFILEEERNLIRISYSPESLGGNTFSFMKESFTPLVTLKELTTKLQSTSIISALPTMLENTFYNEINVHTDETLVMNAEEARESPSDLDIQNKFEEIGKKDFEENILYKKSKRRKKRSSMDASILSTSSNSSEEKEISFTRPTIMNLSTVGVLPDLRSPESIKYDIEYKEKILAEVLNLGKVRISNVADNKLVNDPESSDNDDIVTNEKINTNGTPAVEQKSNIDINTKVSQPKTISETNLNATRPSNRFESTSAVDSVQDVILNSNDSNFPACMLIPNTWGLTDIRLRGRTVSEKSEESLSDWELV